MYFELLPVYYTEFAFIEHTYSFSWSLKIVLHDSKTIGLNCMDDTGKLACPN